MKAQILNSVDYEKRLNLIYASILLAPFMVLAALTWDIWELKTLLIALALMTITALAFLKRELSLYLVVLLIPIEKNFVGIRSHYQWSELIDIMPLFPWIALAAMAGILMRKMAKISIADFATPVNSFILIFFVWACLGLFWARNLPHSLFQLLIQVSDIVVFYLVVVTLRKNEAAHRMTVKILIFIAVIMAGLSIWSLHFLQKEIGSTYILTKGLTLDYYIKHSNTRAKALCHPNMLACFLNIAIAFATGLLLSLKGIFKKSFLFIIIIFLVYGVLEAKSKAGLGCLIILGMFFLVAFNALRAKFSRNLLIFLSIVVGLFVAQNIANGRIPRVLGSEDVSIKSRLHIWGKGFHDLFVNAPGWGLGIGGFHYYPYPHAHSIYFSTFFDFSIIGILSTAGLIIALIIRLLKLIPYQKTYAQLMLVAATGSLLVILVHGLVDFSYGYSTLWFALGLITVTILLVEEERKSSDAVIQTTNS